MVPIMGAVGAGVVHGPHAMAHHQADGFTANAVTLRADRGPLLLVREIAEPDAGCPHARIPTIHHPHGCKSAVVRFWLIDRRGPHMTAAAASVDESRDRSFDLQPVRFGGLAIRTRRGNHGIWHGR